MRQVTISPDPTTNQMELQRKDSDDFHSFQSLVDNLVVSPAPESKQPKFVRTNRNIEDFHFGKLKEEVDKVS